MQALDGGILIVDDDRDTADSFCRILASLGYRARTAYSGGEAIELATNNQLRIVLLDISLPDFSGIEVAQHIRRTLSDRGPRIVAISSWIGEGEMEGLRAAGFDGFLLKPVAVADLRQTIEDCDLNYRHLSPGTDGE